MGRWRRKWSKEAKLKRLKTVKLEKVITKLTTKTGVRKKKNLIRGIEKERTGENARKIGGRKVKTNKIKGSKIKRKSKITIV